MREITIISGKGGTGKTSLCASFAHLAQNAVICDLDVDVPDMHIILRPETIKTRDFIGGPKASIRQDDCQHCGTCQRRCRFDAVREENGTFSIDTLACEGCGVCAKLCPAEAIDFHDRLCGRWHVSSTRFGPFVHAQLLPGSENSGKLVSLLKQEARALAREKGCETILCDGSPGIGCPVISSLSGSTLAVAVTEPTLSGRQDFLRVAGVAAQFRIPVALIVNRADLNPEAARDFEELCRRTGNTLLGSLPFDPAFPAAASKGLAVTETDAPVAGQIRELWNKILSLSAPSGKN